LSIHFRFTFAPPGKKPRTGLVAVPVPAERVTLKVTLKKLPFAAVPLASDRII
jgi:hypothetical protein